jgi:hypothetical protein
MIVGGTLSNFRAWRAARSIARGWSQRMIPFVFVPAPESETANPIMRTNAPPLVMGNTIGVLVSRLKAEADTTKTGRVPCCSCPEVGSNLTR